MPKKLLVTGAAGFIGRNSARHFANHGWQVFGVDSQPHENAPLASLVEYRQMNLPDPELAEWLAEIHPDACIHCAGRASVEWSLANPASDFYQSTALTFEILNILRLRAPACRFVLLSSAAVYGNPARLPVREHDALAPISPYGFHKWQCELLCQEFQQVYGIPTTSLRIFSAYGPGLRRQVIWDMCYKVISQGRLPLRGSGRESRDFVHVLDIAAAVEILAENAPMQGEAYNLGTGEQVTIAALAGCVLDVLGANCQPEFDGVETPGIPLQWQADITKINALGFEPKINIRQGVEVFARWCRDELQEI